LLFGYAFIGAHKPKTFCDCLCDVYPLQMVCVDCLVDKDMKLTENLFSKFIL
jgi:hypothetical protein